MNAPATTQPKDLWCATCGSYRGTTDYPHYGPHYPHYGPHRQRQPGPAYRLGHKLCHDTDTFTDD